MPLLISEIHPNQASGSEWIEFLCESELADNLSPYAVYDDLRKIYQFSSEICLDGLLVIEVSGLNNDKDSVTIKHSNGEIIDSFAYQSTEKSLSWARQADGSFVLTSPSRNQLNPNVIPPTAAPSPTPSDASATSSATTHSDAAAHPPLSSASSATSTAANLTPSIPNIIISLPYQATDIKLSVDQSLIDASRSSRLVFLAEQLPDKSAVISVIMTGCLILVFGGYLLYVKIKSKH